MQGFKCLLFAVGLISLGSCVKRVEEKLVYDNVFLQMDTVAVYQTAAEKVKQKTALQYLSIMYADFFNQAIPSNELNRLDELSLAFGDKGLINEMYLRRYLVQPGVQLPAEEEMRSDVPNFINETYIRFYLRNPTAYEFRFLKDQIENDEGLTPSLIFTSFALSNEYYFY
jgi:hypothetical protein